MQIRPAGGADGHRPIGSQPRDLHKSSHIPKYGVYGSYGCGDIAPQDEPGLNELHHALATFRKTRRLLP
jgi:hypothetical protein